jgi:predicted Fe-Mo cluster-binding NifX family protein
MKIVISSNGKDLDSNIDLRFGRAFGFIIYDLDTNEYNFVDNLQNLEATQGAGIQAAQTVVNQDVEAIITGHCGPKAFKVLNSADIKIYIGAEGSIKDVIEKFKNNELEQASSADVEGHWM